MASCKYDWPAAGERSLIGKRISRIDGPAKSSGRAKYTYDIDLPGLLVAKIYRSPYAHAKITAIDTSEAEKLPGVKTVRVIQGVGKEIQWAGDEIVAVAAVSEDIADDAVRKIKVELVDPQTGVALKITEKGKPVKYTVITKAGYTAPRAVE